MRSTTLQALLVFDRRDGTVRQTIEDTGMFNTMFTPRAKEAAYLILANAQEIAAFQDIYIERQALPGSQKLQLQRMIKSLDTVI